MDPGRAERIRTLLRNNIDWQYLVRTASRHGVVPLLYWHLDATCPDAVPKATLDQLRRYFHVNAFHNRFLAGELLKLLRLFEAHGIPAIPYKGPVLAVAAYGNLSFRQFADLDILIHKQDILRAKDLLSSQGYQLPLTAEEEAVFLKDRYHYHFTRDAGRLHVEIHWAFTRRYWSFPIDLESLWDRLEPVSLIDTTVPSFHPEDLLLILCAHASKHDWKRLAWVCDVAELIRAHQELDWEQVMGQAARLRSERIVFLGLLLAKDCLGAILPERVLQRVQAEPVVQSLAAQLREQLFAEADCFPRVMDHVAFYLRMRERSQDRMAYLLYCFPEILRQAVTPNEKDRALLSLPVPFSSLYYLLRPIRLVKEYGLRLTTPRSGKSS